MISFQDFGHWITADPLPSYGRGIDVPGGRYRSLINGQNLSDVIITGMDIPPLPSFLVLISSLIR